MSHSVYSYASGSPIAFSEVQHAPNPLSGGTWMSRGRGDAASRVRVVGRRKRRGQGTASLLETAASAFARLPMRGLVRESLQGVPWALGKRLWKELVQEGKDSVHAWAVFAMNYGHLEDAGVMQYRRDAVKCSSMRIEDIRSISPAKFEWITFLTLSDIVCSRADLVGISNLQNLAVLCVGPDLENSDVGVDDTVIRAWSRAVSDGKGAFGMLRVLCCRRSKFVTHAVFEYLNVFPALAFFLVERCEIGHDDVPAARSWGWGHRTTEKLIRLANPSAAANSATIASMSWSEILRKCFFRASDFSIRGMTREGVDAINSIPRLDLALGTKDRSHEVLTCRDKVHCFERNQSTFKRQDDGGKLGKRQREDGAVEQRPKRREIRVSKQSRVGDAFTDFGF